MTTNSQLLTTEPKQTNKQNPKQTRIGTESQKWRSPGGLSVGIQWREIGEKVQRIRSIIGRYKIGRERLRIV